MKLNNNVILSPIHVQPTKGALNWINNSFTLNRMKEKNNNNTSHNNGYLVFFVCFTTPTQKTDFMNTDTQLTSLILNLKIKHHIPQLIFLTYPYHPHTDKQIISLETWKIKRLPLNLVASTTNVTKCYLQFITCASYNRIGIHLMGSWQEKN